MNVWANRGGCRLVSSPGDIKGCRCCYIIQDHVHNLTIQPPNNGPVVTSAILIELNRCWTSSQHAVSANFSLIIIKKGRGRGRGLTTGPATSAVITQWQNNLKWPSNTFRNTSPIIRIFFQSFFIWSLPRFQFGLSPNPPLVSEILMFLRFCSNHGIIPGNIVASRYNLERNSQRGFLSMRWVLAPVPDWLFISCQTWGEVLPRHRIKLGLNKK